MRCVRQLGDDMVRVLQWMADHPPHMPPLPLPGYPPMPVPIPVVQ
jgi:hypothetical protein